MSLNKQKGNMYNFISHTWNPIRGKCPHDCSYCYMKSFKVGELRLDEKALKDDLGMNNFIFVGSSTDIFANEVDNNWIESVLGWCCVYPNNTYLFQTKNPSRFFRFEYLFPSNTILGTTIETNREIGLKYSKAPSIIERLNVMVGIDGRKMITIEPIFDFDLDKFIEHLRMVNPEWINIGADSKGHKLLEPSKEKVEALIKELKKFTKVYVKDNLKRLTKGAKC